jgi:hypothetical protein
MDFDIKETAIGICAKRKSGKSELVRYIIDQYHDQFSKMLVISTTEAVNKFYHKIEQIDDKFIYDSYSESFVKALYLKMEKINEGKHKSERTQVLLIMDDCMSDFNARSASEFKKIFTKGRHVGLTIIVIQQYIYHIPPVCRTNCDYVFVSQMNSKGVTTLAEEYRFGNIEIKDFKKMFLKSTSDFGFLLINCNCAKNNDSLDDIYGIVRVPADFISK